MKKIEKAIKYTKYLDFHYKILHWYLPTPEWLQKTGINQNNICHFCDEIDDVVHTFSKCPKSQQFWEELEPFFKKCLKKNIPIDVKTILIYDTNPFINKILMIAKWSIWFRRRNMLGYNIETFKLGITDIIIIEIRGIYAILGEDHALL